MHVSPHTSKKLQSIGHIRQLLSRILKGWALARLDPPLVTGINKNMFEKQKSKY